MADIVVFIEDHPRSYKLVDAAYKKAQDSNLPWLVLVQHKDDFSESFIRLLSAVKKQGGTIEHLPEGDTFDQLKTYLSDLHHQGTAIKHLFLGQLSDDNNLSIYPFWHEKALAEKVQNFYGNTIEVTTIPLTSHYASPSFWQQLIKPQPSLVTSLKMPLLSSLAIWASVLIIHTVTQYGELANEMVIATSHLTLAAYFALKRTVFSALIVALLGLPGTIIPSYINPTIEASSLQQVIHGLLYCFLAACLIWIAGSGRIRQTTLTEKEKRYTALLDSFQKISSFDNLHEAAQILQRDIKKILATDTLLFIPKNSTDMTDDAVTLKGADHTIEGFIYPPNHTLEDLDCDALVKCWALKDTTGFGTLIGLGTLWRFELIASLDQSFGVLGVRLPLNKPTDATMINAIADIADQCALALDRIDLIQQHNDGIIREEREKLRSMLLASISHDLKTPLSSVIGSLSALDSLYQQGILTPDQQNGLVQTSLSEAKRLDSFISNILSITKLESGAIQLKQTLADPLEALNQARKMLTQPLQEKGLILHPCRNRDPLKMDQALTAQVLQNVLDNALKYDQSPEPIEVSLIYDESYFYYCIRDHGPGIPAADQYRIFDKYARLYKTDSQIAGTGLGLSICKAVMALQHGDITVRSPTAGNGAEFIIQLPYR